MQELEEALVIIKKRKEKNDQELDFLQKVEEEKNIGLRIYNINCLNYIHSWKNVTVYFYSESSLTLV